MTNLLLSKSGDGLGNGRTIDVVLVPTVPRFSREPQSARLLLETLRGKGIRVESCVPVLDSINNVEAFMNLVQTANNYVGAMFNNNFNLNWLFIFGKEQNKSTQQDKKTKIGQ